MILGLRVEVRAHLVVDRLGSQERGFELSKHHVGQHRVPEAAVATRSKRRVHQSACLLRDPEVHAADERFEPSSDIRDRGMCKR